MTDQAATASIQEATPLCKALGVRAEKYAAEEVGLTLDWARELCTTNGILHGGVIMALADSAGDAYALLNMPKDATGTATIESKTNFLGAVRSASPRPRLPSTSAERTIVIETAVRDAAGRLIAKVTQTQIALRTRS